MDYAAAKSTMCRQCGRHFSPSAPKPAIKLRGDLHCTGTATIDFVGKFPGRLSARHLVVTRKADVQCFRQVTVGSVEIKGRMSGEIVADTSVTIDKNASLEGNVAAKAITVEKGGIFSGQLVIGQADLTQAELLPEQKAAISRTAESSIPGAAAQPLPAT